MASPVSLHAASWTVDILKRTVLRARRMPDGNVAKGRR